MKLPIIVNLWAGPGCGKSTTASLVFHILKIEGYRAELCTEFAKELTYTGRRDELRDQLWVSAVQEHRHRILIDKVDIIVTDSPTGLGGAYVKTSWKERDLVAAMARFARPHYDNMDFWLMRDLKRPYQAYGRRERTLGEAQGKDDVVREVMMHTTSAGYTHSILADAKAAKTIADAVKARLKGVSGQ